MRREATAGRVVKLSRKEAGREEGKARRQAGMRARGDGR